MTNQTADIKDDISLSLNHFLYGLDGGEFAPDSVDEECYHLKKQWRRVQELVKHFLGQLIKEWLPGLNKRHKWFKKEKDFRIGDITLVLSTESKQGKWVLGRISDVFPGNDNHVRGAKVKIGGQEYIRPIFKLCPLECKDLERIDKPEFIKDGENDYKKI